MSKGNLNLNLDVLKEKILENTIFVGIVIKFGIFALSWE